MPILGDFDIDELIADGNVKTARLRPEATAFSMGVKDNKEEVSKVKSLLKNIRKGYTGKLRFNKKAAEDNLVSVMLFTTLRDALKDLADNKSEILLCDKKSRINETKKLVSEVFTDNENNKQCTVANYYESLLILKDIKIVKKFKFIIIMGLEERDFCAGTILNYIAKAIDNRINKVHFLLGDVSISTIKTHLKIQKIGTASCAERISESAKDGLVSDGDCKTEGTLLQHIEVFSLIAKQMPSQPLIGEEVPRPDQVKDISRAAEKVLVTLSKFATRWAPSTMNVVIYGPHFILKQSEGKLNGISDAPEMVFPNLRVFYREKYTSDIPGCFPHVVIDTGLQNLTIAPSSRCSLTPINNYMCWINRGEVHMRKLFLSYSPALYMPLYYASAVQSKAPRNFAFSPMEAAAYLTTMHVSTFHEESIKPYGIPDTLLGLAQGQLTDWGLIQKDNYGKTTITFLGYIAVRLFLEAKLSISASYTIVLGVILDLIEPAVVLAVFVDYFYNKEKATTTANSKDMDFVDEVEEILNNFSEFEDAEVITASVNAVYHLLGSFCSTIEPFSPVDCIKKLGDNALLLRLITAAPFVSRALKRKSSSDKSMFESCFVSWAPSFTLSAKSEDELFVPCSSLKIEAQSQVCECSRWIGLPAGALFAMAFALAPTVSIAPHETEESDSESETKQIVTSLGYIGGKQAYVCNGELADVVETVREKLCTSLALFQLHHWIFLVKHIDSMTKVISSVYSVMENVSETIQDEIRDALKSLLSYPDYVAAKFNGVKLYEPVPATVLEPKQELCKIVHLHSHYSISRLLSLPQVGTWEGRSAAAMPRRSQIIESSSDDEDSAEDDQSSVENDKESTKSSEEPTIRRKTVIVESDEDD